MKEILIKREDGYNLGIEQPQGRLLEATCSPSQQLILNKSGVSTKYKLSKQNCDEIFGVVDVAMLARDISEEMLFNGYLEDTEDFVYGFKNGFNKAMELNKDNLFTLEDMHKIFYLGCSLQTDLKSGKLEYKPKGEVFKDYIQSIQQPTEIEVEIEMEVADLAFYENGERYPIEADLPERFKYKPKLDADGCLILKTIRHDSNTMAI